ncbi:MAG TPA: prenyltransferase [Alphaproteobacteria bacterium]|nr:prenyltransferase [Alphaproteobacteria bacterium]
MSVFLGVAVALGTISNINIFDLCLVLAGAIAAHVSVNAFNEYSDFKSGLDAKTIRTPFSGGSGALVANPQAAIYVLAMAISALAVTGGVGLYFLYKFGVGILPVGLLGVLIVLSYTPWLNRNPWLCLVAPGLGFGPLMVVGTHFVLTGSYSWSAFFVSMVPFFLANNLLLLNQYPDIEADRSVGRRHFPIVYGVRKSTFVYGLFVVFACGAIILGVSGGYIPEAGYAGLIPMVLPFVVFYGVIKLKEDVAVPFLAMNVLSVLATPIFLTGALILSQ